MSYRTEHPRLSADQLQRLEELLRSMACDLYTAARVLRYGTSEEQPSPFKDLHSTASFQRRTLKHLIATGPREPEP